jgi:hypothetical protein
MVQCLSSLGVMGHFPYLDVSFFEHLAWKHGQIHGVAAQKSFKKSTLIEKENRGS